MTKRYLLSLLVLIFFISCTTNKYEKLIRTEMSKDIRHDSIFLGFDFGKTKDDFFVVCKKLNEKQLVIQAEKYQFVQYLFPKKTKEDEKLKVLFWGIFDENKTMTGLTFEFSHPAWAPWLKEAEPKNLIPLVKNKLMEWFPGNEFVKISTTKEAENIWVKIDGNRRIVIEEPNSVNFLEVNIDDLRFLKN